MKDLPNYGFPLNSILIRMLIASLLLIFIIFLQFLLIDLIFILLITFAIILIYIFISMLHLKKRFCKKRLIVLKKMIQYCNIKGTEVVLDLGAGAGFLTIGFAKFLQDGKAYGIDKYSFQKDNIITLIKDITKINFIGNTLKNAKRNAKIEKVDKQCEFISADFTKPLDFPNCFFDLIISSQSLYLVMPSKKQKTFQEIDRILKKGGKILFFEPKTLLGYNSNWNIEDVKEFFENIGYSISLIQSKEFTKQYYCFGYKN